MRMRNGIVGSELKKTLVNVDNKVHGGWMSGHLRRRLGSHRQMRRRRRTSLSLATASDVNLLFMFCCCCCPSPVVEQNIAVVGGGTWIITGEKQCNTLVLLLRNKRIDIISYSMRTEWSSRTFTSCASDTTCGRRRRSLLQNVRWLVEKGTKGRESGIII